MYWDARSAKQQKMYNFLFLAIFLSHQMEFKAFIVFLVLLILCFVSVYLQKLKHHEEGEKSWGRLLGEQSSLGRNGEPETNRR